jgi:glutathione S-transferase
MLMLEHKGVPYRRIDFVPLTHPFMARLHGFDAGGERRVAGDRRPRPLRTGDRLGTVPGLAADGRRVSTNRGIARFLDEQHPEPPLFPADPEKRAAVEEAERWANGTLQMAARRVLGGAVFRDPDGFARSAADGRMGYLLFRRERARRLLIPWIVRRVFAVDRDTERAVLAELPGLLDRVDALIGDGVIGGAELNAADFMVAPSLALMLYDRDLMPEFEGRPALDLLDRVLPEP